jgi:glycosyltransferase involved in cell wall biosynthesis
VRVLYFITELNVGGAERSLSRLLAGLDRAGFVPTVACLYGSDSPVADDIRALGIPVHDLGMQHKWRLDAFWRLYRLLRREGPAILHTLLFHANIPGRVIGRLAGVPIVVSGERTMGMEGRWRYRLSRLTQGLADRVVCVSQQVANFVTNEVGVPGDKIIVIPNGVEVDSLASLASREAARKRLGLPADGLWVGTVARLDPVKRLDVFLEALALLDGVQAAIVGYGPEEGRLKALAEQLGIAGRVLFAGHQIDVRPWLEAMDVFVLSSDWEGMSNALLEAMAVGLPVVATATGGTPDVVIDRITGFLVPLRAPHLLAQAIRRLLADRELRTQMGQAGHRRVAERFSIGQMIERTQALYQSLLEERAAPSADGNHLADRSRSAKKGS